jgi:phosphoserine phosphatase
VGRGAVRAGGDANGGEVVRDLVQVDGKDQFVWRLGLAPGSYSVQLVAYSDGRADLTLQVGEPAAAPQVADVQLEAAGGTRR